MTTQAAEQGSARLYSRLLSYVRPYKAVFSVAVVAMVITALTETSFAALLKPIMDSGFVSPDPDFIAIIPWLLVLVLVARAVSGFVANYSMAWVGRRVVYDLRRAMFNRLIYLPAAYFDDHSSATLVSRLIYDVEQASTATTDALTLLVRDSLTASALLGWMFYLDWKLSLVFLVFAPLVGYTVKRAADRFRSIGERIQVSVGGIAHVAKEAVIGQRVVKTFSGQEYEKSSFDRANNHNRQQAMKKAAVAAALVPVILLVVGVGVALVIHIAVTREGPETLSAGTFVSYLGAVLMLMSPLKRLAKVNEKIQTGVAAASSIFDMVDQAPEPDPGSVVLDHPRGRIEYRNVSFRYGRSDREVLSGLSFVVEPGQTVALVGASGSGKSTIAALLMGFYRPDSGQILVDGVDLTDLSLASLRASIATVTQETILFDDSIRNNIVYGAPQPVSEEQLRRATAAAHIDEFVDPLPAGLDTLIGEQGIRLSGGQRQRISIARALFKDAPILILDEATSSLDAISERLVQDATERLIQDRTTLVIAHRLSTIENADRIHVLDGGIIVETGRHAELVAKNGVYAGLYRSQLQERARLAG